jgi:hypothetical protein
MFQYKKEKDLFYIWSDKSKWKFWAFIWIFCRNRYLWETTLEWKINNIELEKKYPWYNFSFWYTKTKIFIISKKWIEIILKK